MFNFSFKEEFYAQIFLVKIFNNVFLLIFITDLDSQFSLKCFDSKPDFLPCETAEIWNLFTLLVYQHWDCYILSNIIEDILFSGTSVHILAIKGNWKLINILIFEHKNCLSQSLLLTF